MVKPGAIETGLSISVGAARHRRHALAGGVELAGLVVLLHPRPGLRMRLPRHAESGGDAFAGDVVVGRADAAGGEHVVEAGAALVDRRDDGVGHVGDDADLAQRDADGAEAGGDELDVGVLGAAGEHLVADDEQAGDRIGHQRKSRNMGIRGLSAGGIG